MKPSPFKLMHTLFWGLAISLAYGFLSAVFLYFAEGKSESQSFLVAYNISFKTLISLGLSIGTALIVFRSQIVIPDTIETALDGIPLPDSYTTYKKRFVSARRSMEFAAEFFIIGFFIFSCCQFPLPGLAEKLMIVPACIQYALGVYVGRKLCYAGLMLHSLLSIEINRNLFKKRELDAINSYVHIASTLTIIGVYLNILGYYEGPFLYQTVFGLSPKIFLLLPALIATPVLLIFNFYPRAVLRKIYSQSIDIEIKKLQEALQSEQLSSFEKKSYILEVDRMSREELRYSLQLTLSDLPIGVTILIMVLQPLLGK
jgi:hypothetical protein